MVAVDKAALCARLQSLVTDTLSKHMYTAAVFYGDKLCTLSSDPSHTYLLAQALFMSKQYRRTLHLLRNGPSGVNLAESDIRFKYLAGLCLAECGAWEDCISVIGDGEGETMPTPVVDDGVGGRAVDMYAALYLLRGRAFAAQDNRTRAVKWLRAALATDPLCYDAFALLIDNHMLTGAQERELVASLDFAVDDGWLAALYAIKCKKTSEQDAMDATLRQLEGAAATPSGGADVAQAGADVALTGSVDMTPASPGPGETSGTTVPMGDGLVPLPGNIVVMTARAEWYAARARHEEAYEVTHALLQRDPYALECLPIHICAALELGKKNDLFLKAHQLVEEHPKEGVSWFAVGCYYLCTRQYENARRHFGKATTLAPSFAPAWIGFGHAFALQDESDQAMAAYRTAARLFPGLHLPVIGMGLEYQRMKNLHLADQMFLQAQRLCPSDPLVANELGVLHYANGDYPAAAAWLRAALELVPTGQATPAWEPTVVNLAHTLRKQGLYTEAIMHFEWALGLCPATPSTYTALGYTHHLAGSLDLAIENYHKALGLKPDDAFANEMLGEALRDECIRMSTARGDEFGPD